MTTVNGAMIADPAEMAAVVVVVEAGVVTADPVATDRSLQLSFNPTDPDIFGVGFVFGILNKPMLKTLSKPRRKAIHIGPEDHGRRMSLDDFDEALAQEGYLYELNKGVIEVSGIPEPSHGKQIQEIRDQLTLFRIQNPGVVDMIGGGGEAKILVGPFQSERHPDLSVYLDPPPDVKGVWSVWIPAIVIEVVSERSSKRDYQEKPEEYLAFGVKEYWIVDSTKKQMQVMSRSRGEWSTTSFKATQKFKTPLLPGFALDLKKVFAAAK